MAGFVLADHKRPCASQDSLTARQYLDLE